MMNVNWEGMLPILGTILVVQDDLDASSALQNLLDEHGATSRIFPCTDKAFTYLLESHAACPLLIVDYEIPGEISGRDFIKMVRAKWPAVRSILTTEKSVVPLQSSDRFACLQKPWSTDQVISIISFLLKLGNLPAATEPYCSESKLL